MTNPREELERRKGARQQLIQRQGFLKEKLSKLKNERQNLEQAQTIIQNVAQLTQEELKYQISEIVTLALAAVFDDPYEFIVQFEQRRNQTECDLYFKRNGELIDPLTASGGGATDVAAFALRIALWSLRTDRTRNIMILDEPLRFLSKGYKEKAQSMIKMLSQKLNLQIIMVTHDSEFISGADKVHNISIKKGVSRVSSC